MHIPVTRCIIIGLLSVIITPATEARALIQPELCKPNESGTSGVCEKIVTTINDVVTNAVAALHGSQTAESSSGSSTRYVPYDRITTGPDGETCTTTGYREVTDPTVPDSVYQIPDQDLGNIFASYPPCPDEAGQSRPAVETPTMIAIRYWEEIPLPPPKPHIAPGWAITGKLAYLETNGELTHRYTNNTPFGPLELVATGAYYVNWGDGESTGPHAHEGRPWPSGEITHEYIWAGVYNIVVTERWTATWTLAGENGVLRELHTTGTIDHFPARQIQAVIR